MIDLADRLAATVDRHLAAIQERDLDAYTATLAEDVTLVLPNASRLDGRDAVVGFHREWFAEPSWTIDNIVVRSVVSGGTAVIMVDSTYREDGSPAATNALALVFTLVDDTWLLIHDQNTRVPPKP